MTASAEPSRPQLARAEYDHIRSLYALGEYTLRDLADEYDRSYETIRRICQGIVRPLVSVSAGIRSYGPPRPAGQPELPVVLLSQRQRIRGRLWWPTVATQCLHCGGLLLVRPADWDDGEIACALCARAVATVGRELW